ATAADTSLSAAFRHVLGQGPSESPFQNSGLKIGQEIAKRAKTERPGAHSSSAPRKNQVGPRSGHKCTDCGAATRNKDAREDLIMYRWFESLLNPFPPEEPVEPPRTLVAFCMHYTKGSWPLIIISAILTSIIALTEVWMFGFLGNVVDWLSAH